MLKAHTSLSMDTFAGTNVAGEVAIHYSSEATEAAKGRTNINSICDQFQP